ncbi:MAG TPA: hypothetical protein VEK57_23375 [Thermoanaerobaculia bacterium]|nr:hypothetical protein [Thermoanaerobaculia bacterium]
MKPSASALLAVFAVLSYPPTIHGQELTVTSLAGPQGGAGFDDGTGSEARFNGPSGVATDNNGNIYVADRGNSTIRKITPAGAVTTLAGLAGKTGSADGTGSAGRFFSPTGVSTDSSGNVYVADSFNQTIRIITAAGTVSTLAGHAGAFGSDDGTGSAARFKQPSGVATDTIGNVYVADTGNSTVRKITAAGAVTTLPGLSGLFVFPEDIAVDISGNVYVTESQTIRKITPAGAVTTLAGLAGNPGNVDGTGSAARFFHPRGVATDSNGNVYVADLSNHTIRRITPGGVVTTLAGFAGIAGSADGTASAARFDNPIGVATDSSGNVYVADSGNNTIRKINPAGSVTTLAGRAGVAGRSGSADGTASAARFNFPSGVATDSSGNVYVGDSRNNTIRKVTSEGAVTTLAGLAGTAGSADGTGSAARFSNPIGVATDSSGNVYVADFGNSTIRKITPARAVTTLAGLAETPGSADGTGSAARFNAPQRVATDSSGNVYVADTGNQTIRKITAMGAVTTLAGLAEDRGSVDGMGSAARFNDPTGVATDSSGNVYVADYSSSTIRKITPAGDVTTLAGLAGHVGSEDGTGSAARFFDPVGMAADSSGNVYVADSRNSTIRKISPAGAVITVAGLAETPGSLDGTGSTARFNQPRGVATDSSGDIYVADTGNNAIRRLTGALADAATIDISTGTPGATRQLDTSPHTAISWQWSVIRRPVDSVAILSSASVRNPTFTPDVPGLFMFRLIATGTGASRTSTVDLTVNPVSGPRRRAVRSP